MTAPNQSSRQTTGTNSAPFPENRERLDFSTPQKLFHFVPFCSIRHPLTLGSGATATFDAASRYTMNIDGHLSIASNALLDIGNTFVYLNENATSFDTVQQYWINGFNLNRRVAKVGCHGSAYSQTCACLGANGTGLRVRRPMAPDPTLP